LTTDVSGTAAWVDDKAVWIRALAPPTDELVNRLNERLRGFAAPFAFAISGSEIWSCLQFWGRRQELALGVYALERLARAEERITFSLTFEHSQIFFECCGGSFSPDCAVIRALQAEGSIETRDSSTYPRADTRERPQEGAGPAARSAAGQVLRREPSLAPLLGGRALLLASQTGSVRVSADGTVRLDGGEPTLVLGDAQLFEERDDPTDSPVACRRWIYSAWSGAIREVPPVSAPTVRAAVGLLPAQEGEAVLVFSDFWIEALGRTKTTIATLGFDGPPIVSEPFVNASQPVLIGELVWLLADIDGRQHVLSFDPINRSVRCRLPVRPGMLAKSLFALDAQPYAVVLPSEPQAADTPFHLCAVRGEALEPVATISLESDYRAPVVSGRRVGISGRRHAPRVRAKSGDLLVDTEIACFDLEKGTVTLVTEGLQRPLGARLDWAGAVPGGLAVLYAGAGVFVLCGDAPWEALPARAGEYVQPPARLSSHGTLALCSSGQDFEERATLHLMNRTTRALVEVPSGSRVERWL
jgi:hypothetical protein